MRNPQQELIPTSEVAAILGKSVATINRWADKGKLEPALELSGLRGARFFRRSDVEALLVPSEENAG